MRRHTIILIGTAAVLLASLVALTAPSHSQAAVGYSYVTPADPAVTCATSHLANGAVNGRQIFVHTPWMIGPFLGLQVSYQPMLYKWSGSAWVLDVRGPQLFGGLGLFGLPDFAGFLIGQAGRYYQASIIYRWYSAAGKLLNQEHVWAGTHQQFQLLHTGETRAVTGLMSYCFMP